MGGFVLAAAVLIYSDMRTSSVCFNGAGETCPPETLGLSVCRRPRERFNEAVRRSGRTPTRSLVSTGQAMAGA